MSRRPPLISIPVIGYGQVAKSSVIPAIQAKQIQVFSVTAQNRSGGAIDVGIAVRLDNEGWEIGTITAASTPDFLTATSTIQAGSNVTIFTAVNNCGFLIQAKKRFGIIGLEVTDAAGAGATYEYTYFDGTNYSVLTTIATPTWTTTGTKVIAFPAPVDWVVGTTAAVGGATDLYSIRVRATTAPADLAVANDAWVGSFLAFREGVADNGALSLSFSDTRCAVLEAGEGIMPYFGAASASNTVEGFYSILD